MTEAGFTNVVIQENAAFFLRPEGPGRVDFLRVDEATMNRLLARAVKTRLYGYEVRVPALKDLLAMKIFSLAQDSERRLGKDLPDIAWLVVLHELDLESDIRPLCQRFGTDEVFAWISRQVEALRRP